jgi:uncharacterized protein YegP (UPF0339 family)
MATATKRPAAVRLGRRAREMRVPGSLEFLVFEDNGGAYRWRIVAGDSATLAQSGAFASRDSAQLAAQRVQDGAGSAHFDRGAGEVRSLDRAAGRGASSDELDARRWLDEGGSFSGETVTR